MPFQEISLRLELSSPPRFRIQGGYPERDGVVGVVAGRHFPFRIYIVKSCILSRSRREPPFLPCCSIDELQFYVRQRSVVPHKTVRWKEARRRWSGGARRRWSDLSHFLGPPLHCTLASGRRLDPSLAEEWTFY